MKAKSHQLSISLIIFVIWVLIVAIGPDFVHNGDLQSLEASISQGVSLNLAAAPLFLLAAVFFLGWQSEVGLKAIESVRSLRVLWLPSLFVLLFFAAALALGISLTKVTAFILINTILVGISEELMFRGIVLYAALSRFRFWTAIFFTNILFGSVHVLNGFMTGDFASSTVQAITAGMAGFWFTAVRLRTKSIFPGMIIHGLWDCGLFLGTAALRAYATESPATQNSSFTAQNVIAPILFEVPLFIYAFWHLRSADKETR